MGIFDALTTAVAGLQAQSFALQNISGNIANSQTTGLQGNQHRFQDLVSQAAINVADRRRRYREFGRHQHRSGDDPEHHRLDRHGGQRPGLFRGRPSRRRRQPADLLRHRQLYPGRRLQINANGNLVNSAGYYLMGIPVDPTTGNPLGSVPQVLQFNNNFIPAVADDLRHLPANLPSHAEVGVLVARRFRSQSARRRAPRCREQIAGTGATIKPVSTCTRHRHGAAR